MSEKLTAADLKTLEILLQYDSPSSMYAFLQTKGYKYATLAEGVVAGNSLAGGAAMNFMKLTAQQSGKTLNESGVYSLMAREYLNVLSGQVASQGYISRDINHQEAWAFHNKVFSDFGLGPDAWTLNSVFRVMPSETVREAYWKETLAYAGDPVGEVLMAFRTETFMGTATVIGTPEVKLLAERWRARVDTPSTFQAAAAGFGGAVKQRIDSFFDTISQSVFGAPTSQLPTVDFAPPPSPTPAPAVTVNSPPPVAPTPAPPTPQPPKRPKRRPGRRPPTTGSGHPDSGHHGGGSGGGGGGPVVIIGRKLTRTVKI